MSLSATTEPQQPGAVQVVAALVWRGLELLAAQRLPEGRCAGLWEFPGGKQEPGESPRAALLREAREELGVTLHVGEEAWRVVHTSAPGEPPLALTFFHAYLDEGATPQPLCSQRLLWAHPSHLATLPFCPADGPLLQALARGQVPGVRRHGVDPAIQP